VGEATIDDEGYNFERDLWEKNINNKQINVHMENNVNHESKNLEFSVFVSLKFMLQSAGD
jgi:hypothetical protein